MNLPATTSGALLPLTLPAALDGRKCTRSCARLVAKSAALAEVPLLYGGSAKPENAEALFRQADIDGGLIGGASLKGRDFLAICVAAQAASASR
jgi:triosephosphate isomerase